MPRIGYTTLTIIMTLSSTFGTILNMAVIIVTVRHKQLYQPLNYALVNLAVADLGCAVFGALLTAVTNYMGYFSLGRLGCVLEGFAAAFFGIAGLCSVTVITVDCYMVVCRPLGAVKFQTKHALAGVVFSWIWSFIWNIPPLFGWGSYQMEDVMTSCAPNWYSRDSVNVSYILCCLMLCFALPFATIIISYMRLLYTLRQVAKLQVAENGSTAEAEVHVARMVVVMAFLLTWFYAAFALTVIIDSNIYIHQPSDCHNTCAPDQVQYCLQPNDLYIHEQSEIAGSHPAAINATVIHDWEPREQNWSSSLGGKDGILSLPCQTQQQKRLSMASTLKKMIQGASKYDSNI